jgi:hypothetical protein
MPELNEINYNALKQFNIGVVPNICPWCNNRTAMKSTKDSEWCCPICGAHKPRPAEAVDCAMTADMLKPPTVRMIEFICANYDKVGIEHCEKIDWKKKNSKRVLCADCQKKRDNEANNRRYRKDVYFTTNIGMRQCVCGKEIKSLESHYKSRTGKDRYCKACYHRLWSRRKPVTAFLAQDMDNVSC